MTVTSHKQEEREGWIASTRPFSSEHLSIQEKLAAYVELASFHLVEIYSKTFINCATNTTPSSSPISAAAELSVIQHLLDFQLFET